MSTLVWYWHRFRAMGPGEMALHVRRKWREKEDATRASWPDADFTCSGAFPKLPKPEDAPQVLRDALQRDAENILAGRWKFFGHLEVQIDDPPKWQYDYLVRCNVETNESAFKLDYRSLREGLDSKVIWEPSRWHQLVRLAMATYVLGDRRAGEKCVEWMEDWVKHNPPYRGWNWTSALEVGIRLINFAWIDALLMGAMASGFGFRVSSSEAAPPGESGSSSSVSLEKRLERLRREILPPHVWYAWRHKSFGSSANNHLMGELAGCIIATARWPGLAHCGASLGRLQRLWEREVLAQFAEDGGNREQALNYHLFSWELCWQVRKALTDGGRKVSQKAEERLVQAMRFFWEVQSRTEHWDYGDSDDAWVTPFFVSESRRLWEWRNWAADFEKSSALSYWLGFRPAMHSRLGWGHPAQTVDAGGWWAYPKSGIALHESGYWWLRWDLSPLGYLGTAAHGHLDALHLSIWYKGVAVIIDPGTGAYHADKALRVWLASREAHNGPCLNGEKFPRRAGPFLWAEHHQAPELRLDAPRVTGILNVPGCQMRRLIEPLSDGKAWNVRDYCFGKDGSPREFQVRWQFAPESNFKRLDERRFLVRRNGVEVGIEVSEGWADVSLVEMDEIRNNDIWSEHERRFDGIVSPAFRKLCWAPYLKLMARPQGDKPCVFSTTFLASPA